VVRRLIIKQQLQYECSQHHIEAGDLELNTEEKKCSEIHVRHSCMNAVVVHQNVLLPDFLVSDVLESYHLPIIIHIPNNVRTRDHQDPVEKITDWEQFQSLPSELILPEI
jgi:hypothetical protein